uniref:Uncharacterized protein n=1 Tax=Solanum tuberosum TaxID=4113 RepID=M1DSL0_SOLTU
MPPLSPLKTKSSPQPLPRPVVAFTSRLVAREDGPIFGHPCEATASPPRVAPRFVAATTSRLGSRGRPRTSGTNPEREQSSFLGNSSFVRDLAESGKCLFSSKKNVLLFLSSLNLTKKLLFIMTEII